MGSRRKGEAMAKLFSSAVTWIIILLLAIIGLLAGIAFGWFDTSGGTPSPGPSESPTEGASPTPTAGPAFVDHPPVWTGEYVPSAEVLTENVLASAGSGWVVAIYDTSQIDTAVDSHAIAVLGPKILYLISPDGVRYELANLDNIDLTDPNLVAWDNTRDLLLLKQAKTTLNVFDMATGEVTSSWAPCESGEDLTARYGEAREGNWLFRGSCSGLRLDGIYTDAGVLVPSSIVGLGTDDLTVYDFGDTQVAYMWEGLADEKYVAYYPGGTSASLPWDEVAYCGYPISKGRGDTVAMSCDTETGGLAIEELPANGDPPYEVVSATQLEDFAMANGGFGPGEFGIEGYWSDSALGIVQFRLGDVPKLGVLYGGEIGSVVADPSHPFRRCHAVEGTSALVSGGGGLWWVDFDAGPEPIVMLPVMGSGSPIQTVGTDRYTIDMDDYTYTALRQP
jgi:hypothetical protein